jgi:hypothetical protein
MQINEEIYYCLYVTKLNSVKISVLPKLIYRFKCISIQNPTGTLFLKTWQANSQPYMEIQKNQNSPKNLKKKKQFGVFPLSGFKTFHKRIVIEKV